MTYLIANCGQSEFATMRPTIGEHKAERMFALALWIY
jgi:hypothetical protein